MTGDRLALAIRVRKARHQSCCAACGSPILIGAQIARLIKPAGWCHIECVPVIATLARTAPRRTP